MKPTSATEPNHRILVIDDNRAIHDDMRKVLIGDSATHADLEPDEELLFGATPVAATRFEIDWRIRGRKAWPCSQRPLPRAAPTQWRSWTYGCRPAGTAWKRLPGSGRSPRTCRW